MKILKYTVWIVLLFLLQTVIINDIRLFSVRPDIIIPFLVAVAIKEDSFKTVSAISIICAVLAGALCGKNFSFAVLFYTYLPAIVFNLRRHSGYVPEFMKYILWTVSAAFVSDFISYLILYKSTQWLLKAVISYMLPSTVYTLVFALIMYPLINSVLYGRKAKKQLI